ncbi:hypothetical protein PHYBLDRAFT_143727 [Phycomyces blakesleeanus NRRL 1555(-)]|uniref:Uncharacterized protein n=1 Tax=Phycomyces blakesleeanus (strain ATCC 8743b / DSM 1359 / FGSC 10004 / NBRC 33097 / NRRL 1555) TaxID=763407 RepID=A0A167NAE2_PHYB8|nr:hypothetical protein PHYBLDRAFT_143727 [Phycomyces blakesleeanus NRRL 1555(-)]OAD75484.1 hypothetical protein PHYBLDRAFT_143727 [Phycomyces blakesleeanus NRRL 1555(-)]|eukprot:XP_018293524.1 hypothetical protein PHYBLDRAFT_143727 [Phycomyces blakesleeanus NRRL 1555(-)]
MPLYSPDTFFMDWIQYEAWWKAYDEMVAIQDFAFLEDFLKTGTVIHEELVGVHSHAGHRGASTLQNTPNLIM